MAAKPLDQGDMYFDQISSFVLQADGTVDSKDCHNFTMLYPTYSQYSVHDSMIKRLIPCTYDAWITTVEYQDPVSLSLVKIDLSTKTQTNTTTYPPSSQQNWGWVDDSRTNTSEEKKTEKSKKLPFSVGSVLFHKSTRTKWIFTEIDNVGKTPILKAISDKDKTMRIFEKDYEEFEEIFF
jgi:hypothetical protein